MAFGPGKYDDLCKLVREQSGGKLVIVAVLDGERGSGFSVQMRAPEHATEETYDMLMVQARVMREVADDLQMRARRMRQRQRGN